MRDGPGWNGRHGPHPHDLIAGDDVGCYHKLLDLLHPRGLACPRCAVRDGLKVHRRHRDPVLDYMCPRCARVFNAWTGTALQGTHRPPAHLFWILWGIAAGVPAARTARDLGCPRPGLVPFRRRLEDLARHAAERGLFAPLLDRLTNPPAL